MVEFMKNQGKCCNRKVCWWGVKAVYKEGQKDMNESQGKQRSSGMGCYGGAGQVPRRGRTVGSHDAEGWGKGCVEG